MSDNSDQVAALIEELLSLNRSECAAMAPSDGRILRARKN
jgi:hypothetical protein